MWPGWPFLYIVKKTGAKKTKISAEKWDSTTVKELYFLACSCIVQEEGKSILQNMQIGCTASFVIIHLWLF
jgi:hypothetical protein